MKAGMNTLIAKIGIAAAVVAGISAGAVFFMKNNEEEVSESLNAENNTMIEEELELEEKVALLETLDYPEGFLPYGKYACYEILDIQENNDRQSPLYYVPAAFSVFLMESEYFQYEYDAETKQYTIWDTYQNIDRNDDYSAWDHKFIGHLDEKGNFIITHYERTNYKQIDNYGSEWQNIVLDDIEWVFVHSIDELFIEREYVSLDYQLVCKIESAVDEARSDTEIIHCSDPATLQAIADLENEQDIYSLLSGTDMFTEKVRQSLGVTGADELTLWSHNASGVLPVSAIKIMNVPDSPFILVWIEDSDASGFQGTNPEVMLNIATSYFHSWWPDNPINVTTADEWFNDGGVDDVSVNISDNIEPTDVSEVPIQDLIVTLTRGVYECTDAEEYSLGTIDLINNKDWFHKMNGDGTNLLLFYYPNSSNAWCFHIEGDLVENNLVINYFVRYDAEKLYEVVGTMPDYDKIRRFEEEYPDVADLILDDIEWVYILQED